MKRAARDSTMLIAVLAVSPWMPPEPSLTRVVLTRPGSSKMPLPSVSRSRRNTSAAWFVSPATSVLASVVKRMNRPSGVSVPLSMARSACWPFVPALTRLVDTPPGSSKMPLPSASRSRMNRSCCPFESSATRLEASDRNSTYRLSRLTARTWLSPLACSPDDETLRRTRVLGCACVGAESAARPATSGLEPEDDTHLARIA